MPRPAANMTVVKKIGEVEIYEDLAHLSDEEAVAKSLRRLGNQRRKANDGTGAKRAPRAVSARSMKAIGATAMPAEAKPIMDRHKTEIAAHETARVAMLKRHDEELVRVRKLVDFIQLGNDIGGEAGSGDLTKAARDELAKIK